MHGSGTWSGLDKLRRYDLVIAHVRRSARGHGIRGGQIVELRCRDCSLVVRCQDWQSASLLVSDIVLRMRHQPSADTFSTRSFSFLSSTLASYLEGCSLPTSNYSAPSSRSTRFDVRVALSRLRTKPMIAGCLRDNKAACTHVRDLYVFCENTTESEGKRKVALSHRFSPQCS
jgi:hypothetical protein